MVLTLKSTFDVFLFCGSYNVSASTIFDDYLCCDDLIENLIFSHFHSESIRM